MGSTILTTVSLSHTARLVFVKETSNSSSDTQEIAMEAGDSTTTSSPPREIGMVLTDRRTTPMESLTHSTPTRMRFSSMTESSTTHSAARSVCLCQLNSWMPVTSTLLMSGTVPFSSTSRRIHQRPTLLPERTQTSSRRWETV